jgi:hypothetical protein
VSERATTNYAPDADYTVIKDFSRPGGALMTFQIDTKLPVKDSAQADRIEALLKAMLKDNRPETRRAAYDYVYSIGREHLEKEGPAHAMVQAAFGIISHKKQQGQMSDAE